MFLYRMESIYTSYNSRIARTMAEPSKPNLSNLIWLRVRNCSRQSRNLRLKIQCCPRINQVSHFLHVLLISHICWGRNRQMPSWILLRSSSMPMPHIHTFPNKNESTTPIASSIWTSKMKMNFSRAHSLRSSMSHTIWSGIVETSGGCRSLKK